jgi:hypothetical protein
MVLDRASHVLHCNDVRIVLVEDAVERGGQPAKIENDPGGDGDIDEEEDKITKTDFETETIEKWYLHLWMKSEL